MIIGLTGFYCSGKSTAERFLKEDFGFYVIDMDKNIVIKNQENYYAPDNKKALPPPRRQYPQMRCERW